MANGDILSDFGIVETRHAGKVIDLELERINPVCLSDVHNLTSCRYLYRHTKHKYDCQKHNYKSFLIPFHLHHPFASIKNQAMFLI